jgi:glycosyltransferase involved in cell wall biosynthesis
MLKVCVDATAVRGKLSGVGFYNLSLIQALQDLQRQEDFQLSVYFQPALKAWLQGNLSPSPLLANVSQHYCLPLPVTIADLLMRFPNSRLEGLERRLEQPDIVQGTDHFVFPCRHSRNILTIHDLTFIKYPQYVSKIVTTYRDRLQRSLKWTDAVITFAENTKQDLIKYFKIQPERIYVTPQASRYQVNDLAPEQIQILKSQSHYDFKRPYLLFVGTLEPRKNIISLIKAFNYLKSTHKIEHQLVLIGQLGWKYESILAAIQSSPSAAEIHHLSYLSNEQVALFYSQAEVFVYPSFYEGFGLPILEAMTLGTPVITSNSSSLPEVTGDAALLINANDFLELAETIFQVISDRTLRAQLISQGQERARQFSWTKTAQTTLQVYRSVLEF